MSMMDDINDIIFMSHTDILYNCVQKLEEKEVERKEEKDKEEKDKEENEEDKLKKTVDSIIDKAFDVQTRELLRQNVLFSYLHFILEEMNQYNADNPIQSIKNNTYNIYVFYKSIQKLSDADLSEMRVAFQKVASAARGLMQAQECFILCFDERTQSSNEIAWDCDRNYEDGGEYSEHLEKILQTLHKAERETKKKDDGSCLSFSVTDVDWKKWIVIAHSRSNVRVLKVSDSKEALDYKDWLITIRMPLIVKQHSQRNYSVYFAFRYNKDNKKCSFNEEDTYKSTGWRYYTRFFNTFSNSLMKGISNNLGYILSEKFFYPMLKHKEKIIILHISDLHNKNMQEDYCLPFSDEDSFDLLVVTGDLVQADSNANTLDQRYRSCKKELIRLAKKLFKYEWRDRVLIVPGNHDYASMNEVIVHNSGRVFNSASAPSIIEQVSPRVKFAYYLDFLSCFRREFFYSDKLIDCDINYIDHRFDEWGISFLLLNSSIGVSAHRQNKVALSHRRINLLQNEMDKKKFNICMLHHTPLFKIMYVKDQSSVFGPIQEAFTKTVYNEDWSPIPDRVLKIMACLNRLYSFEKYTGEGFWSKLFESEFNYAIDTELGKIKSEYLEYVAQERIIWYVFEKICENIYLVLDTERNEKAKERLIKINDVFALAKQDCMLIQKICEGHSEVLGRIAQEKTVADDDRDRYRTILNVLLDTPTRLFLGGHQHLPGYVHDSEHTPDSVEPSNKCQCVAPRLEIIQENGYDNPNKKDYYAIEAGKYCQKKNSKDHPKGLWEYCYNVITIYRDKNQSAEDWSCSCRIITKQKASE